MRRHPFHTIEAEDSNNHQRSADDSLENPELEIPSFRRRLRLNTDS